MSKKLKIIKEWTFDLDEWREYYPEIPEHNSDTYLDIEFWFLELIGDPLADNNDPDVVSCEIIE